MALSTSGWLNLQTWKPFFMFRLPPYACDTPLENSPICASLHGGHSPLPLSECADGDYRSLLASKLTRLRPNLPPDSRVTYFHVNRDTSLHSFKPCKGFPAAYTPHRDHPTPHPGTHHSSPPGFLPEDVCPGFPSADRPPLLFLPVQVSEDAHLKERLPLPFLITLISAARITGYGCAFMCLVLAASPPPALLPDPRQSSARHPELPGGGRRGFTHSCKESYREILCTFVQLPPSNLSNNCKHGVTARVPAPSRHRASTSSGVPLEPPPAPTPTLTCPASISAISGT